MGKKHKRQEPMFPDLPYNDPEEQAPTDVQAGAPDPLADLRNQITALTQQMTDLQKTNAALMSQQARSTPPQRPGEISSDGLPDPTEDPAAFTREFNRRVQKHLADQQAYSQWEKDQQAQTQERENAVWSDFSDKYKEYAADPEKVRIAAERAVRQAKARGRDPEKYIYGATTEFMRDVVTEYDKFFGKPKAAAAPDDDDDDDDETDHRTAGLPGGVESGGRVKANTPPVDDDMFADIRAFQIKNGYHR